VAGKTKGRKGESGCCCESCDDCGCACSCDCSEGSAGSGFRRLYQTRAEQIAELGAYLRDLKDEVQAVEERLAELKRKR